MLRPRLVFAHYFGGSARSWAGLVDALGDDVECIVPNLPGFGGTEPPSELSLDAYVDAFDRLAGAAPYVAVGHSMGGKIVLALAARNPPAMTGLILIAASPPTPEPMTENERQASLDAYASRGAARRQLSEISGRLSPDVRQVAVEDKLRVAEPVWRWWLEEGSRDDILPATGGLALRTLVIGGDDDKVMGDETAPMIARRLGNATLRNIPDAGHLLPLERPEAVAALIRDFIGA